MLVGQEQNRNQLRGMVIGCESLLYQIISFYKHTLLFLRRFTFLECISPKYHNPRSESGFLIHWNRDLK